MKEKLRHSHAALCFEEKAAIPERPRQLKFTVRSTGNEKVEQSEDPRDTNIP